MAKPKRKYYIYCSEIHNFGDGEVQSYKNYVGETLAVSEAQAINNYCYREGVRRFEVIPWYGEGFRMVSYEAVPIIKNKPILKHKAATPPKNIEPPKPAEPEWENISLFDRSYEW